MAAGYAVEPSARVSDRPGLIARPSDPYHPLRRSRSRIASECLARDIAEPWARVWLEPWQTHAGCLGVPLEVFFIAGTATARSFDRAREICAMCPVIVECRETTDRAERGLTRGYLYGLVGGETPVERARRRAGS